MTNAHLRAFALGSTVLAAAVIAGCGDEQRPNPARPDTAASAGRIAYVAESSSGTQLVTVRPDGSSRRVLDHLGSTEVANPDWSADGRRLVYEISTEAPHAGVIVADADGRGARDLTPHGFQGQPAFTPDGRSIVFERQAGGNGIWIMRADGSDLRRLTRNPFPVPDGCGCDTDPNVSPDGTTVTFVRVKRDDELAALFSMRIDGTHLRRLTPYDWDVAVKHAWSPDGTRIALTRNANFSAGPSANIVTIRTDGSDVQPVTRFADGRSAFVGSYSPDGRRLVARIENGGAFELATMGLHGGALRVLARSTAVKPRFIDWGAAR
jgi:Tol biopolymer transport system component